MCAHRSQIECSFYRQHEDRRRKVGRSHQALPPDFQGEHHQGRGGGEDLTADWRNATEDHRAVKTGSERATAHALCSQSPAGQRALSKDAKHANDDAKYRPYGPSATLVCTKNSEQQRHGQLSTVAVPDVLAIAPQNGPVTSIVVLLQQLQPDADDANDAQFFAKSSDEVPALTDLPTPTGLPASTDVSTAISAVLLQT